ncbi:MAG TPA: BrnA antitoxin family protein [Gemmatimonadaceae bacterium]
MFRDTEWDPLKAVLDLRKHGIAFAEAVAVLEDPLALMRQDDEPRERRRATRRTTMRKEYDFSNAKRGAVLRVPPGKTRITIRLDDDVIAWFHKQVNDAGGGNYQTLINQALRQLVDAPAESIETTLRRVVREEIRKLPSVKK